MSKRILTLALIFCCGVWIAPALAQQDLNCSFMDQPITQAQVFFNYGSATDAFSIRNRSSYSLGQPLVGNSVNQNYISQAGFWASFLIPPLAPTVIATQGELLDRIQVSWAIDPLGAQPAGGFKLYRDGVFLALVDRNTTNYNDFNVIAGRAYSYEVRGLNDFGEGIGGKAIGFQVPNGVVTGLVQTASNQPVPDAFVTLTPLQGFSANFDSVGGAFAMADTGTAGNLLAPTGGEWSLAFWVKTSSATAGAGVISLSPFPLILRPIASAGGHEGIEVAQTDVSAAVISGQFPDSTKNDWHHVALTADVSGKGRLYIDGRLVGIDTLPNTPSADELRIGARTGAAGTWQGMLDELRIYHRRLNELDLGEVMMGTAFSGTPGLKYYWKMDEELGTGSFDLLRRNKLFFCGVTFDADRPLVRTMGKTDQDGFYRIESASYGTGTTFLAEPMKDFYMYRALQFVRDSQDYALLPDFSLTARATLELWVNSAGADDEQCLLAKTWPGNDFRLLLTPNGNTSDIQFYLNGDAHNFGPIGVGYQHLAFTIDSLTGAVAAFKNSIPLGSHTFTPVSGNWSNPNGNWIVGALASGGGYTQHFGGLIDEIAVYDTILNVDSLLSHFNMARNAQEKGLRTYFAFDEGNGNRLNNNGSVLLPYGTNFGADWSAFAARQRTTPHIFTPATRQVTLNPSVTSVDQVDFVDRSTVPVTGYVRYKNTDCFAQNVEILVNGASFSPKIFTDSTGKFTIDFDPGATAILTPVFSNHNFIPAFWEVTNVVNPIAGILFSDVTTRKISGKVGGGLCKKSIITAPPGTGQGTVCIVKIRSVDGCLERQITLDNQEGDYEFLEVPPLESITVAVVEHSNPDIKEAFQQQGGSTVDVTQNDTIIDFIYFAPPKVEISSGLDPFPGCSPNVFVLDQNEPVTLNIKLKEVYVSTMADDGVCYLDTADFQIINGFSDETLDTAMANGNLKYKFVTGAPNPSPPYLKTLQIIGTSLAGRDASLSTQAIVTGIRNKENTFTTVTPPEIPTIILRDPPGDGSSSFLTKKQDVCKTTVFQNTIETGGGISLEVKTGKNEQFIVAPFGVGKIFTFTSDIQFTTESQVTYRRVDSHSFETCVSFSENVSTSKDPFYVGGERGGDVYVGAANNIIFGLADEVTFDNCAAGVKSIVTVQPGSFPTTFIYSEFNIRNQVMRYLDSLTTAPAATPDEIAGYIESKQRWQAILDMNAALKDSAAFVRNISFSSGVNYDYSETSDTTDTYLLNEYVDQKFSIDRGYGFKIDGIGFGGKIKLIENSSSAISSDGDKTKKGVTIGYSLSDNDPGDSFTVDVGTDEVYKTPVFKIRAGQSSCPWEPGTANRDAPNVALGQGSSFVATNVPSNGRAIFNLNIGNLSASNEDRTYSMTHIVANNPNGAAVKVNGVALNNNYLKFIVPYGESIPVTLTIERGPQAYDYDSLLVGLVSDCEIERNFALSLPLPGDPKFFSALYLGAHFIRPCSEVDINVPEQNWVVLNNDPGQPGTVRRITVSNYDLNSTDFQLVRLQYRRTDGDGAWINIPGTFEHYNPNWSGFAALPDPKPPILGPDFTQFFWETAGLSDGPYEIHAWAVCTGDASDKPGFSEIIKGRIDREPPNLVGVPQPSDGVFNVGDEISFTFNKFVNCNKLIPADITQANNVGLYDATTDQLIDANITCFENKIIIDPNFQNKFFENRILRAELHDIEDLTGNNSTYFKWEFYVDRNELAWPTDSLGMTKYEDQTKTTVANIHNRGGYPVPFTIEDIPAWVHVVPNQGTLAPNEIRPINFTVDSSLAFGLWSDSITLHTETGQNPFFMGGDEGLPFGVRVVCRPPNWDFNPNLWENSQNMVIELNIQGDVSTDAEDIIVAYIGDTLCGRARLQYVPAVQKYLAYLTIYGNPYHLFQPLRFEVWDASECLRYAVVENGFLFQPDDVIGDISAPQVMHTNSRVLRDVPLGFGWNWLSFNLAFPDSDIDSALFSLNYPENDLMKSQNEFSVYMNSAGWLGSLQNLGNTSMYIYRADMPDTLKMLGFVIPPATTPIQVVSGWNWIGYIPNYSLPVNSALS